MVDARLYLVQRLTAILMIPLVIGHLAVMIYAVQGGLTTEEILSRTQGSIAWAAFYGLFVAAASAHAAIGLSTIASEWLGVRGWARTALGWGAFMLLAAMGARAVYAVTTTSGGGVA